MASFISNCFLCPAGDEEVWMTFSGENVSITMHRVALVSMDVLLDSDRRETFLRNAVQMAQNTKDEPRPALPVSCGKLDGGYRANDHLTISDAHRLLSVLRLSLIHI